MTRSLPHCFPGARDCKGDSGPSNTIASPGAVTRARNKAGAQGPLSSRPRLRESDPASALADGVDGLIQRRPLLLDALLDDLAELAVGDGVLFGDVFLRLRNAHLAGVLGRNEGLEDFAALLNGQSLASHEFCS